jgi:Flp pilus assembly protein TadG
MRRLRQLLRERRGSAAIEFAFALPVLIVMIWGMFQIGILFMANAGMQHALGEGARYATLCTNFTSTGCTVPTDAQIQSKITTAKFGLGNGTWTTPTIQSDTATNSKKITVSFQQPTSFLLFDGPTVRLTQSKVIYLSS